jgi:hypothetical protein
VVSFIPWLLCPQGKIPWFPLDKRLGGPEPAWMQWKREKFLPVAEIEPGKNQFSFRVKYSLFNGSIAIVQVTYI